MCDKIHLRKSLACPSLTQVSTWRQCRKLSPTIYFSLPRNIIYQVHRARYFSRAGQNEKSRKYNTMKCVRLNSRIPTENDLEITGSEQKCLGKTESDQKKNTGSDQKSIIRQQEERIWMYHETIWSYQKRSETTVSKQKILRNIQETIPKVTHKLWAATANLYIKWPVNERK